MSKMKQNMRFIYATKLILRIEYITAHRVTFPVCIQVFLFLNVLAVADRRSSTTRLSGTLSRSIQVHITLELHNNVNQIALHYWIRKVPQ